MLFYTKTWAYMPSVVAGGGGGVAKFILLTVLAFVSMVNVITYIKGQILANAQEFLRSAHSS